MLRVSGHRAAQTRGEGHRQSGGKHHPWPAGHLRQSAGDGVLRIRGREGRLHSACRKLVV